MTPEAMGEYYLVYDGQFGKCIPCQVYNVFWLYFITHGKDTFIENWII